MNETWPFRAGANDMELAQNITGAKLSEAGLSRKRRCNGMDETWHFVPGRGIWSLHRRCDEARLHFSSLLGKKN